MKRYFVIVLVYCLSLLTACFKDDTVVATDESIIDDITITGLKDTTVIAFSTLLELEPEVTGYTEDELTYAWYVYGGELPVEGGYRTVKIADTKKLSYQVDLKQGSYTLVFEATHKENGYTALSEMGLKVSTAFSQGFYILKETAEGKTDLDLYNNDSKEFMSNVLEITQGEALMGAPRELGVLYGKAYVDPETAEAGGATVLFVASGENEMACFRTEDMMKVFDRSTILFDEMAADEVPYCVATTSMWNFYFSSKGVRGDTPSGSSLVGGATGKLGFPEGEGASMFIQACDGSGLLYWDENVHRLRYCDSSIEEVEYFGSEINWDEVSPVATGWNHLAGVNTLWYIFEDFTGQRYLVFVDTKHTVTEVRRLDPDSHLAQADLIAGNGLTSYSIYMVHNNQLWMYSLEDGAEVALSPTSLPAGEITYLVDLYFSSSFDYLVIGLQNGNEYVLYMYQIEGGQPYGAPEHIIQGEGKVKKVRYVSQSDLFMPNYYAFTDYAAMYGMGPDFPY